MKRNIKALMTARELKIVEASSLREVRNHSAGRLKQLVKLTRKLRDKYRDLTRRQKLAQRDSQNLRTTEKAKLFAQTLSKYEKRYQKVRDSFRGTNRANSA